MVSCCVCMCVCVGEEGGGEAPHIIYCIDVTDFSNERQKVKCQPACLPTKRARHFFPWSTFRININTRQFHSDGSLVKFNYVTDTIFHPPHRPPSLSFCLVAFICLCSVCSCLCVCVQMEYVSFAGIYFKSSD